jgi:beta-lactamase regulating signal transducer with metallopeptidase domain
MPAILQYLLKLSVSAGIIYAFYYLVLRRLTFYHLNRWYLTGYTLLCLIIPFINISPIANKADEKLPALNYIPMVQNIKNYVPPALNKATPYAYTMWDGLIALLAIGSLVLLIKLSVQLVSFIRLKQKAERLSDDGTAIYHIDEDIMPFSFGNSIYLNKTLHTEKELEEIIMHEYVHVKQMHSADILVAELFCVLNWYNPFAWLIRHSIRQNLEFIADDNVVRSGIDKKAYQYHLLKVVGIPQYRLANQFNFSSLKKRIIMMNRNRSAKIHLLKFMFILPLLAVTLMAFRSEIVNTVNKITTKPATIQAVSNPMLPVNILNTEPTVRHKKQLAIHPINKEMIQPDSAIKKSMNITAYFDGQVLKTTEINNSYLVITRIDDRFDSYSNLTSIAVKKGDKIKKGQLVGTVDVDTITGIPQLKYSMYKGTEMVYDADGTDTSKRSYNNVYITGYGPANLPSGAKNSSSSGYGKAYVVQPAKAYKVSTKANAYVAYPAKNYTTVANYNYSYSGSDTGKNRVAVVRVGSRLDSIHVDDAVAIKTAGRNKVYVLTRGTGARAYNITSDDELVYTIDPRHLDEQDFTRMEKQFADNGFKLKINNHHNEKLNIQISASRDNSTSSASFSGDDLKNSTCYIRISGDKKTGQVSISTYPLSK